MELANALNKLLNTLIQIQKNAAAASKSADKTKMSVEQTRGFGRGYSLTPIWMRSTRRLSSSMILRYEADHCLSGPQVLAGSF